jgi:hypothetical protein
VLERLLEDGSHVPREPTPTSSPVLDAEARMRSGDTTLAQTKTLPPGRRFYLLQELRRRAVLRHRGAGRRHLAARVDEPQFLVAVRGLSFVTLLRRRFAGVSRR